MAQDAYHQYQSFNWDTDANWLEYKAKLEIPSGNPNLLILKQQKWFKNNVNADFDPSFRPGAEAASKPTPEASPDAGSSSPNTESAADAPTNAAPGRKPNFPLHRALLLMTNLLVLIHAVFAVVNLFTPFFLGPAHFGFVYLHSGASYFMLLMQSIGWPKFSKDYLAALLNSENLQYVMYCMLFGLTSERMIALFPILVYATINVGILLPRCLASLGLPLGPIASISSYLKENKAKALILASNIEVAILVSIVLDIFSGNLGMALPAVAYWNFLTTRWRQSSWTKMTVAGIERAIDGYLLSPRCPTPITALYVKLKAFIAAFGAIRRRTANA